MSSNSKRKHMPLQNRVDAFGDLIAVEARGTVLGNRGGRFHRDDRTLGKRRHVSHQWICCRLEFNGPTAMCGVNTIRSFSFSTKSLHFPPVTARASNAAEKTRKLLLRYGPTTLLPIAGHAQRKWIYLCNPSARQPPQTQTSYADRRAARRHDDRSRRLRLGGLR